MLGSIWYHSTIKNYVVAFAYLFKDVKIFKFDNDGKVYGTFNVPIMYKIKSKMYAIKTSDQKSNGISNIFPRMTFRIQNLSYDEDRQKNKLYSHIKLKDSGKANRIGVPKPCNFRFVLSIFTRNTDDQMMIIEQIAPFFMPEYVMPITEISEFGESTDIKLVMDDNIDFEDLDESNIYDIDDDINQVDIGFNLSGNIYPPIKTENIIKNIKIKIGTVDDIDVEIDYNTAKFEEIIIT